MGKEKKLGKEEKKLGKRGGMGRDRMNGKRREREEWQSLVRARTEGVGRKRGVRRKSMRGGLEEGNEVVGMTKFCIGGRGAEDCDVAVEVGVGVNEDERRGLACNWVW